MNIVIISVEIVILLACAAFFRHGNGGNRYYAVGIPQS